MGASSSVLVEQTLACNNFLLYIYISDIDRIFFKDIALPIHQRRTKKRDDRAIVLAIVATCSQFIVTKKDRQLEIGC